MISVVLPAYNAEKYLDETLCSIRAQTFKDFELLIVDDGSTDRTIEIATRHADEDARIRIIRADHGGISAALNRGIAEAKFPWIARIDGDDVALPERFARQIAAAAEHPEVVAWGTYAFHYSTDGRVLGLSRTGPTSVGQFRRLRSRGADVHLIHPTTLLRREVVLQVGGYDSRYNDCEDFELFDRMAVVGPIVAIPEPLLLYRIHSSSVSMKRFFNMRRLAAYVQARQKARLEGIELTLEQYQQDQSRTPFYRRLHNWTYTTGGFYYRRAGLCYAGRQRAKALGFFCVAACFSPWYTAKRIWWQVLSRTFKRISGSDQSTAETAVVASD